ncbi:MAG: glycosyltransferase [Nannocystaceae bacterium]
MTVRRLSIFLPRDTEFYSALLEQMKRGFAACGIDCSGALSHPNAEEMKDWCALRRPQVVFEMNRCRRDVPYLPPGVRHVVWLVDLGGRRTDYFEGSDITYFFGPAWAPGFSRAGFRRCLVPGACPVDYAPAEREPSIELGFVGHVPKPWSAVELDRDLTATPGELSLAEFLPEFEREIRTIWDPPRIPLEYLSEELTSERRAPSAFSSRWRTATVARNLVKRMRGAELVISDEKMRYDLFARVIRHVNRGDLAHAMVKTGRRVGFFGPEQWRLWPAFAPFYRGWLSGPAAMRRTYASTRFNLHEGEGVHFRSMDILSTGSILVFRKTNRDRTPGGIASLFEPGEHYIECKLDNLSETIAAASENPDSLARMGREVAGAVRRRHTWHHRAREILHDLDQIA